MTPMSKKNKELISEEQAKEELMSISTYVGEGGQRFFLNEGNGDSQKKWLEGVNWAKSIYEPDRAVLLKERDAAVKDRDRLDFLDRMNASLNARYGTTYKWELIINENIVRLTLPDMLVDLNDARANGLQSCRDSIDARMVARDSNKEIPNK